MGRCIAGLCFHWNGPLVYTGDVGDSGGVAARIKANTWLAPEQTIITSSCGFNHLPRHVALGKLAAMSEAKRILGGSAE